MLVHLTQADVGESAIEIIYKGDKKYAIAAVDNDGGSDSSPLIKLGVSDTSAADALANAADVVDADSNTTVRDAIALIKGHNASTSDHEVDRYDFDARQKNSLLNDSLYHGSAEKFLDDAGSNTNIKGSWTGILEWDNDASSVGFVSLRIAPVGEYNGAVAIAKITGYTGDNSGAVNVDRKIYKYDGSSSIDAPGDTASATATLLEQDYTKSALFFAEPVVVRDKLGSEPEDVTATTLSVQWGFPSGNDRIL